MPPDPGPFAALSLIVAPAVLTNACSLLILSTGNRLARAVDRARELTRELDGAERLGVDGEALRLDELATAEQRSLLLIDALRSFYVALSGFAAAALLSLLGVVLADAVPAVLERALQIVALGAAVVAVGSVVSGSVRLVRETRLAVGVLRARADAVRARLRG